MKKTKLLTVVLILVLLQLINGEVSLAQTAGNFTFTVTTTAPSGTYGTRNLIAIWIEDNSPTFVKTKIKYASSSNYDHLATWVGRSGQNVVDATTGATRLTHGTISFIWNGTDVAGNVVPDGTYNVWLEMAWDASLTTGKTVNSYSFVKGSATTTSNPGNTANFLSVSLVWTPSVSTGIDYGIQNEDIRVFPNPTSGLLNINFKHNVSDCLIQVVDDAGVLVFKQKLSDIPEGAKSFNLGSLAAGAYYITLHMPGKDVSFRIIKSK